MQSAQLELKALLENREASFSMHDLRQALSSSMEAMRGQLKQSRRAQECDVVQLSTT